MKAWERGELVEPIKPIVWYVDDAFPESWKQPIRDAVLGWNKAFEKIGFCLLYTSNLVNIDMADPKDRGSQLNFFNASSDLLGKYKEEDLRKDNYIVRRYYEDTERHLLGYAPYGKFAVDYRITPSNSENFAHAFRLAEAYLNLAEAEALDDDEMCIRDSPYPLSR